MKKWLAKLLADTKPEGRNAFRIALIIMGIPITNIPLYYVLYLQTQIWQLNAIIVDLVLLFIVMIFSASLAKDNKVERSVGVTIASLFLASSIAVGLISGLGLTVGIGLILIFIAIVGQTLSGKSATRALVSGFLAAIILLLMDFFAPWSRLTVPIIQNIVPYIVVITIVAIGSFTIRQFRNYNLGTKLMIAFVLISSGIVVVLGFQSTTITRNNLTEQAYLDITATAQSAAQSLDLVFDNQLDAIRTEAQIIDLVDYLSLPVAQRPNSVEERRAYNVLQALSRKDPVYISSYALLDSTGTDLIDTTQEDLGINKSDRDYFIAPFESGLPYISPIRISQTTIEPSIYFSAPVRNTNGDIIGVLRARYNATLIQNLLINFTNTENPEDYAVLVDNDTFIRLADTGDPDLIFKTYQNLNAEQVSQLQTDLRLRPGTPEEVIAAQPEVIDGIRNLENQPIFSAPSIYDGVVAYSGGYKLENANWTVLIQRTERSTLAPIQSQIRSIILTALAIIALAAGTGALVAQVLSRPLSQLANVAKDIASGNLNARTQIQSQDEIGALANSFNLMANQLQDTLSGLEQRVADRTKALATSTEVSRGLSTILNQDELVSEVVKQVQQAFNYYHAHIYLWDENRENLVMAGGTGEAGRIMLASGHSIPAERGLVGRAAETGTVVLVSDVTQTIGWLPNPLLPDTKAEIAIPILLGDSVLGVLDVQHHTVGGLDQNDADLLQAIANQVAIALQNARAYTVAQKQAAREVARNEIIQKIQDTSTIEDALKVAIRELGRSVGQKTIIRLGNGSNDRNKEAQDD